LKLVACASEFDESTVSRGPGVRTGYFRPLMEVLERDSTVLQFLEDSLSPVGHASLR